MLENFKNTSLITKILYLFTVVLFLVWVIPSMVGYYSQVNEYQTNLKKIEQSASKYGLENNTKKFDMERFQQEARLIFDDVNVKAVSDKKYGVAIKMKKEDIKKFHVFLEKISLRFYVQVVGALEFNSKEKEVEVNMTLLTL